MTITVTAPRPTEEEILAYRLEQERGDQELGVYKMLLEEANEKGRSFAGHLNKLDAAGILEGPAGNRYNLFMKKYEQDMDYQKRFGDQLQKERRSGKIKNDEDMDPFVLEELIKQRQILKNLADKRLRGLSSREYTRLANGGSPEQELVNQRIAELMMEEPTGAGLNEMRATNPDMFERQKLGIERLLSNLYEPRRSRDIAETISTGIDFTPLGDPAAIAEGFQMMGDGQPFMGAALMAGSIFTNMPANKLKGLLKKADEKLDNLRTRQYQAESKMKGGLSKADFDEGFKESNKVQAEINKTEKEITEIKEALNPTAVSGSGTKEPDFFQSLAESNPSFKKMLVEGRKDAGYIKPVSSKSTEKEVFDRIMNLELSEGVGNDPKLRQIAVDLIKRNPTIRQSELDEILKRLAPTGTPKQVKGIINATPETQKLYQELLDSPSAINTPRHNKVGKDASEQLREIKKQVEESDLEDRNEVLRLLAQLRDKKPK